MHKVIILYMFCVYVIKYVFHVITWFVYRTESVCGLCFRTLLSPGVWITDIHLPIVQIFHSYDNDSLLFILENKSKSRIKFMLFLIDWSAGFYSISVFLQSFTICYKRSTFNVRVNTSAIWFTSMTLLIAHSKKKPHWLKTTPR